MRKVYIEWAGAVSHPDQRWKPIDSIAQRSPLIVKSLGFLLHEDDEKITIAAHVADDEADGDLTIPRGMVRRLILLDVI